MTLSAKMFSGALWSTVERISSQAAQFLIGVLLARILSPTEYGTYGIIIVFIAFFQLFIDSGFSKALIQKQDRSASDISTVFIFNIFISVFSFGVLWFLSPFIAEFYSMPILKDLIRVISISLIFNALYAVPITLFNIKLDFKSLTKANLLSIFISGAIGIYFALNGSGVWALVYQTVTRSIVMSLVIYLQSEKFSPTIFSKTSFREMFAFGSNLLVSSILNTLVNNISALFIARTLSARDLGLYSRGTQFADLPFGIFSSVINSVLLPSLSTIQQSKSELIRLTKMTMKTTSLIVFPFFIGLAVLAKPLIILLLTEKWLMAVPIMQIICLARVVTIISGINVNILYVLGKTNLALRQQYFKIVVRIILLLSAIKYGIVIIAIAELISTIIHFFINAYYPGKILKFNYAEQLKAIFPFIFCSLIMIIIMYIPIFIFASNLLKILVGTILGIPVYLGMIYFLKVPEYLILIRKIKDQLKEKTF